MDDKREPFGLETDALWENVAYVRASSAQTVREARDLRERALKARRRAEEILARRAYNPLVHGFS